MESNPTDQWRYIPAEIEVGMQMGHWACRYCNAPVTNPYGPWYEKTWNDEFGYRKGPIREETPRSNWIANHEAWCIVPNFLVGRPEI